MNKSKAYSGVLTVAAVIIAVSLAFAGKFGDLSGEELKNTPSNDGVAVHFFDVGQGDSEFIELPDGKCMLIDAAVDECGGDIVREIRELGYRRLDFVVATHPHSDHIGGMSEVISAFDIGEIYMPRVSANTEVYENLLMTIAEKGLEANIASAGKSVYSVSEVDIEILAPSCDNYGEINDYSAVVKITYGESSFLFTGDAEKVSEREMLERDYALLNADVLKVAHHGSDTSSTSEFISAVSPDYAVISCGKGNSYGHPDSETLRTLNDCGAEFYRTDEVGTVTISCDAFDNYNIIWGD